MSKSAEIRLLNASDASSGFLTLTAVALRPLLHQLASPSQARDWIRGSSDCLAWGFTDGSSALGLLLARVESSTDSNDMTRPLTLVVLSLAVRRGWRRQGIAGALMDAAQNWARHHQIDAVAIDLPLDQPCTPALQAMTAPQDGWSVIDGLLLVTVAEPQRVVPLYKRLAAIAARQQARWGWHVEPLNDARLEYLRHQTAIPSLPQWAREPLIELSDASGAFLFDPEYCRLLLHDGSIIGWILCHRLTDEMLRYTAIWVEPPWDQRGALFELLVSVLRDAHFHGSLAPDSDQTQGSPFAKGCFGVQVCNEGMRRLSLRQFKAVACCWIETQRRIILL